MRYLVSGTFIFFLLLSHHIFADQIYLKNGDHISGQLISLSPTLCTFVTSYQILQIKREQLEQLHLVQPVMVRLHSSEQFIGTLTPNLNGTLSLNSQKFGVITLQLSEIKAIESLDKREGEEKLLLNRQGRGVEGTPENIGKKDEENRQQFFLPHSEVLLIQQGEQELDVSVSYTLDQSNNQRERDLAFSLEWHTGITDRLESYINLPFIWAEQEEFSEDNFNKNHNVGIGDVSLGLSYLIVPEGKWPDIIGSLRVTTPTGEEPDLTDPSKLSLGSGHWHVTTDLTVIRSYDPLILFGNIGYTHVFANTFNGTRVAPGDQLEYVFGTGFAANDRIALFSQFIGIYQTETKHDGTKILGSTFEPMLLQNHLTYSLGNDRYIQPSVTFGLNDDAADVMLHLAYFHKF